MRPDRFEYFATYKDQEAFFAKIDSFCNLKIVERCFDKDRGPRIFEGLIGFLHFLHGRPEASARRSMYYASTNPGRLQSRNISGSDRLAEFDLMQNPDVLTLICGEQLDHERLLLSQIGRSKASREATKLLSGIKQLAKGVDGKTAVTVTGELLLPNAFTFADKGGRLVRTPDAPPSFDARIAC